MKLPVAVVILSTALSAQTAHTASLTDVKRVYVAALSGRSGSDTLRELIIASLDAAKLFVLTDDPDRADAILKGAAEEHTFEDTFDNVDSVNTHSGGGKGGTYGKTTGLNLNLGAAETESHHIKERKHEAFAAVRLCSKDGDVLWSTTQESLGAKFRGAGADVAAKVAKQLTFDVEKARKTAP
jgi:hypothetical protein